MKLEVRKRALTVETIHHDRGPARAAPLKVGVAQAVIANPFAGAYVEDIAPFMSVLRPLGDELAIELIAALGGAGVVEAYGKGAIIGADGELEHGALWHEPGGHAMRAALGEALAIVPSSKTVGAIGARLMLPLGHINAAYVRSHFSATEMGLWDAPRGGEIVLGLAMATGGRVHERVGGFRASDIAQRDGLR